MSLHGRLVLLDRFTGTNEEEANMKNPFHHQTGRILASLVFPAAGAMSIATADGTDSPLWEYSLNSVQQCQGAMNDSMESAAECFLGDGVNSLNSLFDKGIGLADKRGKETFGENFSITGKMAWSPDVGSMGGLDMVTPFSFTGDSGLAVARSASFMQQGVTRWHDGFGSMRNDLRHGVVHRFRISDKPDSDILGVSSFYLHNVEHGHEALALGMDYFGRWGTGEFRYFSPTTGWKAVRPGREERPLEGMELGARLNLTTTIDLSVTGYQWEADDGSGGRDRGTRMGINWRPHPYLTFDATWDGRDGDESMAAGLHLSIPLGSRTKKSRWEWFGVAGGGNSGNADMWQAVPEIGHIRVASRSAQISSSSETTRAGNITVKFLQAEAATGSNIGVHVSIPAPRSEDLRLVLRLAPGSGSNSAVPGEDFVDEQQAVTIAQGETSATVYFQLLNNAELQTNRSLAVTVSLNASS